MSTEQNKALLLRYNKEVIEAGNMDFFTEITTADFFNHSALPEMPTTRDGIIYFFSKIIHVAFTELKVEILDMVAEGNKVATRKTIFGTHTGEIFGIAPTGKKIAITIIDIFTISDGKLVEHWGENNFGAIIQSLQA